MVAEIVVNGPDCIGRGGGGGGGGGGGEMSITFVDYVPGSTTLSIYGHGFGLGGHGSSVTVSNADAQPFSWTDGDIEVSLSNALPTGTNSVDVNAYNDDDEDFEEDGLDFAVENPSPPPTVYMRLQLVGTVINSKNNYSEDSTIRVTAVDASGDTLTDFTGTVKLAEAPPPGTRAIYTQNAGSRLPPSVSITAGGTATLVAKSLAGPATEGRDGTPPLPAVITTTNYPLWHEATLPVPQWITTIRIDPRAAAGTPSWLQAILNDDYNHASASDPDLFAVLSTVSGYSINGGLRGGGKLPGIGVAVQAPFRLIPTSTCTVSTHRSRASAVCLTMSGA